MPFPEYSFQSKDWGSYLIDIRQAVESNTHALVATSKERSRATQTGIQELRSDFNWALMLVADRLTAQTDLLQQVVDQLTAIHHALDAPLLTQANELLRIGMDRFAKGLHEKALQVLLQAEEKIDVDFPLQLQIGYVYLYGSSEEESVIDLLKAEEHLLLAARYARADQDSLSEWHLWAAEAYFQAGRASYLQAKKEREAGDREQMLRRLEVALDHTTRGIQLWSECGEGRYLRAKALCLLDNGQAAIDEIKSLVDRDRKYLARACNDEDFDTIRDELAKLPQQILTAPGPTSRQVYNLLQWALVAFASARNASLDGGDLTNLDIIGQRITQAQINIERIDTNMECLLAEMQEIKLSLLQLVNAALSSRIQSLQQANRLNHDRIAEIERSKKEYTGRKLGCLLVVVSYFVVSFIVAGLLYLMGLIRDDESALRWIPLIACSSLLCGLVLFVLSKKIGSRLRNPRLTAEIASLNQTVAQRDHEIATWTAWLRNWQAI